MASDVALAISTPAPTPAPRPTSTTPSAPRPSSELRDGVLNELNDGRRALRQQTLWKHVQLRESRLAAEMSKLGPFEFSLRNGPPARHLTCANYDACLTLAAVCNWGSFTCEGCRKAVGTWVEDVTPSPLVY